MRLIGCDPGKASGYAVLNTKHLLIEHMSIDNHNPYELLERVDFLTPHREQVLVVENFSPRWGQKFDLDSVYHIGAMQGAYGMQKVNLVMPATHKGSVPRAKVKSLMQAQGYKIGAGHSLDALSLCLYWAGFKLRDTNVLTYLAEED